MSRTSNAAAFLLHATPYRETSLVVDLFTRDAGRVAAVAKGARRPRSPLRAVLLQFQPLTVAFSGKGELRTLTGAEWASGAAAPRGDALLCAFYLNELIVRLLAREDAHPRLYDQYEATLAQLGAGAPLDETLRRFEWQLLREIGYAPDLRHDAAHRPIEAGRRYAWSPGDGFVAVAAEPAPDGSRAGSPGERGALSGAPSGALSGSTLLGLEQGRFDTHDGRTQAKYLTRAILAHHLDGRPLKTRQILIDLHKL